MLFQKDILFLEHKQKTGDNKTFNSVVFLDSEGQYRSFNYSGNVESLKDLKNMNSCVAMFKVRFGKDKDSYKVLSIDIVSIVRK